MLNKPVGNYSAGLGVFGMKGRKLIFRFFCFVVLASSILLLCSCSKEKEAGREKVRIRWYIWADPTMKLVYERMVEAFKIEEPNIEVRLEAVPWTSYENKLLTMMVGNSTPDVFTAGRSMLYLYTRKGGVLSIDNFVKADKDLNIEDFYKPAIEACQMDDKLYALPKELNVVCMFYNKTLFDRAGVSYPKDGWTWADFLKAAQKLTISENGRKTQAGYSVWRGSTGWLPWVWQNGGDLYDNWTRPGKTYLEKPEFQGALQFLVDLVYKYDVAPTPAQEESMGGIWYAGRLGIMTSWINIFPGCLKQIKNFDWDVVPPPMNKKKATRGLVLLYAISSQTKHPEESYRFLKFLSGPEAQKIIAESRIGIPARKSIAESTLFIDPAKKPMNLKSIVDSIEYAEFDPGSELSNFSEINAVVDKHFDYIFLGKISVKEGCLNAKSRAEKMLSESRER
ncbi:MAG: sugar ABC transporter substrate-binding protein [bacterium]